VKRKKTGAVEFPMSRVASPRQRTLSRFLARVLPGSRPTQIIMNDAGLMLRSCASTAGLRCHGLISLAVARVAAPHR
jgi:hypothetical protein